jgi:hypothetical protein
MEGNYPSSRGLHSDPLRAFLQRLVQLLTPTEPPFRPRARSPPSYFLQSEPASLSKGKLPIWTNSWYSNHDGLDDLDGQATLLEVL